MSVQASACFSRVRVVQHRRLWRRLVEHSDGVPFAREQQTRPPFRPAPTHLPSSCPDPDLSPSLSLLCFLSCPFLIASSLLPVLRLPRHTPTHLARAPGRRARETLGTLALRRRRRHLRAGSHLLHRRPARRCFALCFYHDRHDDDRHTRAVGGSNTLLCDPYPPAPLTLDPPVPFRLLLFASMSAAPSYPPSPFTSPPASPLIKFRTAHAAPARSPSPRPSLLTSMSSSSSTSLYDLASPGVPLTPAGESYLPWPRTRSPSPMSGARSPLFSPPATPSASRRASLALAVSLSLAGSVASSRQNTLAGNARARRVSQLPDFDDEADELEEQQPQRAYSEDDDSPSEVGDIFCEGDLFGEGVTFDGHVIRAVDPDPASPRKRTADEAPPRRMEVIKLLGTGSYAAVYAVRELLEPESDGDGAYDDEHFVLGDGGGEEKKREERKEGRMFALKALSKKNLDESQLEIQMYEAKIHQSLPVHPNIVTLHHTLETPNWLFLLMEYCPGQDLFYWLEGRSDEAPLDEDEPLLSTAFSPPHASHLLSATPKTLAAKYSASRTPPTPSLLANADTRDTLVGRARLRLISRMFEAMCEAVAVCHENGVSHRDIKPENFIITDGYVDAVGMDGRPRKERRVVCKLTDFGLSTTDVESGDFDCGSKSYMAYECRNNLKPTYAPAPADVWSLGIVLLNMLYKRNPWSEPTPGVCPSFDLYCAHPVRFLTASFEGMTESAAEFLANRVFCEAIDADSRVSAREFAHWARDLVNHIDLSRPTMRSASPAADFAPRRRQTTDSTAVHVNPVVTLSLRAPSPDATRRASELHRQLSSQTGPLAQQQQQTRIQMFDLPDDPAFDDSLPSPLPMPERQLPLTHDETEDDGEGSQRAASIVSKRRKRGARKNKRIAAAPSENANAEDAGSNTKVADEKDESNAHLAAASQYLLRELSSAPKLPSSSSPTAAPASENMAKAKDKEREDGESVVSATSTEKKRRWNRSIFKIQSSNPDLETLARQARELEKGFVAPPPIKSATSKPPPQTPPPEPLSSAAAIRAEWRARHGHSDSRHLIVGRPSEPVPVPSSSSAGASAAGTSDEEPRRRRHRIDERSPSRTRRREKHASAGGDAAGVGAGSSDAHPQWMSYGQRRDRIEQQRRAAAAARGAGRFVPAPQISLDGRSMISTSSQSTYSVSSGASSTFSKNSNASRSTVSSAGSSASYASSYASSSAASRRSDATGRSARSGRSSDGSRQQQQDYQHQRAQRPPQNARPTKASARSGAGLDTINERPRTGASGSSSSETAPALPPLERRPSSKKTNVLGLGKLLSSLNSFNRGVKTAASCQ